MEKYFGYPLFWSYEFHLAFNFPWYLFPFVRNLDTFGRLSTIFIRDNFCDFISSFLYIKPFLKKVYFKSNDFASLQNKLFPFRADPFSELSKINFDRDATPPLPLPLLYLFPLTPAMLNKLRCNCWPTRLSDPGC